MKRIQIAKPESREEVTTIITMWFGADMRANIQELIDIAMGHTDLELASWDEGEQVAIFTAPY